MPSRPALTFRDFMEGALYDSSTGFYATRPAKRDFYTAPELHPAFGMLLAEEIVHRLQQLRAAGHRDPFHIVEMGAGHGTLSAQIMRHIKAEHGEWFESVRNVIIERSQLTLLAAVERLGPAVPHLMAYSDLSKIKKFRGVVLSNELVDAFPVHLVEKANGELREVYVENDEGARRLRTRLGKLSHHRLDEFAQRYAKHLEEGQRHAVNIEALEWIAAVAEKLEAGHVITVDYGDRLRPGQSFDVRTFERHTVGGDALSDPGKKDITASVDFAALEREGERLGLETVEFLTLGRFLMDRGILEMLPKGDGLEAVNERNKMKTLFHPDGMGDRFKVLVQKKGV